MSIKLSLLVFLLAIQFSIDVNAESRYRFGYINAEGSYAIYPKYEYAKDFSEGIAAVIDERSGKLQFINTLGKVIFQYDYDKNWDLVKMDSNCIFSEGLAAIPIGKSYNLENNLSEVEKKTNFKKLGYVDKNGKIVITPIFYEAYPFFEGKALVVLDKFQFIDKTGNVVVDSNKMKIAPQGDVQFKGFINGMFSFRQDIEWKTNVEGKLIGKEIWNVINSSGKLISDSEYDLIRPFSDGLAPVNKGSIWIRGFDERISGKWGFINNKGTLIIKCDFDDVKSGFSEGLAAVYKSNLGWGYIDRSGKLAIKFNKNIELAGKFSNEMATVQIMSKVGYIITPAIKYMGFMRHMQPRGVRSIF